MRFYCSHEDTEAHTRFQRLLQVLEFVHRASPSSFDVFDEVETLEDHQGELTVTYRRPATDEQMALFQKAWGSMGGKPSENVHHAVLGGDS